MNSKKIVGLPAMAKTDEMTKVERRFGNRDIRLVMADLWKEHGSQAAMAKAMGIDQSTVSLWALRCGLTLDNQPVALLAGVEI